MLGFKAPASSEEVNKAFLSRTHDTSTKGKLRLEHVGTTAIADPQAAINEVFDAVGMAGESDAERKNYSSNNVIEDGDSRKTAIGKLDAAFDKDAGHSHDGSAGGGAPISADHVTLQAEGIAATEVKTALLELKDQIDTGVTQEEFAGHVNDHENPHGVTAAQAGINRWVSDEVFDGEETFKVIDVSTKITDSRNAIWQLSAVSDDYEITGVTIKRPTAGTVRIECNPPLDGSYRLTGIEVIEPAPEEE